MSAIGKIKKKQNKNKLKSKLNKNKMKIPHGP
jgi:hypothetical protein